MVMAVQLGLTIHDIVLVSARPLTEENYHYSYTVSYPGYASEWLCDLYSGVTEYATALPKGRTGGGISVKRIRRCIIFIQ